MMARGQTKIGATTSGAAAHLSRKEFSMHVLAAVPVYQDALPCVRFLYIKVEHSMEHPAN